MNDFARDLKELIDKWRDHPGTDFEEIVNALIDAIEELAPDDDN